MNKQLLNFHILLFFILGISFFFHKCSIDNTDHLTFLYAINASIAILVYWIVFLLRNNNKGYLGYYFLGFLYMFTFGFLGIGIIVDLILFLTGNLRPKKGEYLTSN